MSTIDPSLTRSSQVCILLNTRTYTIVSIQIIKIEVRATVNKFNWMDHAHLHWFTLDAFDQWAGYKREEILARFDPLKTWHDYKLEDNAIDQ